MYLSTIIIHCFRHRLKLFCFKLPALLFRRCLQLAPESLSSFSRISLLLMLVGVLLRERLEGFEYCLEGLWLVAFKSGFSKDGDDILEEDDAELE